MLTSPREKNRPWFLGWLTQWTQQRKSREEEPPMTPPSPRSQSNKRLPQECLLCDDNSSNTNASGMVPIRRTSTNQSTSTSMTADTAQQPQRRLARHVPQHRLSFHIPLTTPSSPTAPLSERRNSQQTTNSSILSDDQYSSSSCHRRNSSERSILGDLWSKARKHHPHYPRFHWPHYHSWRYSRRHRHHNHHHHHHRHHLFEGEEIAHSVGRTPRRSHDELLINHDTASAQQYETPQHLASSYQEPQHQFLQTTTMADGRKRHSIISLTSGETSLGSRPASIFRSQPGSPVFAALLKNGHLCDDHENDDVDSYWLDNEDSQYRERWVIKPELVQLAMDDGLFCSPVNISSSAIATEKHVLQVGCGDGAWAMDVARSYPKWIVVGMDDKDGGPPPIRRFAPKNFKFIRCHDTLLESLKNVPSDSFDLVHCRFLTMSYTAEQYQQLVKECWRVCKSGGFVELLEMDMRIYYCRPLVGQVTQTFNSEVIHTMESKSLDPRIARRFKDILSEAAAGPSNGDGKEHKVIYQGGYISLPLGVWGGRIGVMFRDNVRELFEQYQAAIAEFKQTEARNDKEIEDAFEAMDDEMEAQEAFMNLHHAYAQKL